MSRLWTFKYWLLDRIPFVITILIILTVWGFADSLLRFNVADAECKNSGYMQVVNPMFGAYYCQVMFNGTMMTVPLDFAIKHPLPWGRERITPKEKVNG